MTAFANKIKLTTFLYLVCASLKAGLSFISSLWLFGSPDYKGLIKTFHVLSDTIKFSFSIILQLHKPSLTPISFPVLIVCGHDGRYEQGKWNFIQMTYNPNSYTNVIMSML